VRVLDDPLALGFGRLGQATFVDEEGRLLLGSPDDPLCLFLRLLDDALALGIDPLGGADLFGDGDTELIDESEGGVLVDDNVRRERQLLAVGDQRLEALDEKDDVDRSALQAARLGSLRLSGSIARGRSVSVPRRPFEERRSPVPGSSPRHRRRRLRSP
jgi:hypothetical protein